MRHNSLAHTPHAQALMAPPFPLALPVHTCTDRSGQGWGKLVRRGLHTLKQPQYQLVWVDTRAGMMSEADREASKVLKAAEVYRSGSRGSC